MYRDTKWAQKLISMQDVEGKWGWFHSLSTFSDCAVTTEQALRRLQILGYTREDACIQKAVAYMDDCLTGKKQIPDRREKLHDWDIFTALILSTWIRRFTTENKNANAIAEKWAKIIAAAFAGGEYDHRAYVQAYREVLGLKPQGGRLVDFTSFYQVSMLTGCLDEKTERAMIRYILDKPDGIYYIYDKCLSEPPKKFQSREASRYLGAVELLAEYPTAREELRFAAEWLEENRNENGNWDMGKSVKDGVWFPLSNDWRKQETREADCTCRISRLLAKLKK